MNAQIRPADPDYIGRINAYCDGVVGGEIITCRYTRLAVERHLADLEKAASDPDYPYYFDEWHAGDVLAFYELMPHIKGVWDSPTLTAEPWICFILGAVFGWRRKDSGVRRYNTVYLEVARKNAKSAISSVVALYCLTCEGEPGPEVRTAATTGDQAKIVYDVARKMALRLPQFCEAFGVDPLVREIRCALNDGEMKPINAKASTQDGLNPHCAVLDELHAHDDRDLFDVLRSARGSRKNPLSWYITTAGYNIHGVAYEQRRLVVQILEGVIQLDHYFGIIYTIDDEDREEKREFDPTVWPKANPNWGKSVQISEFEEYAREAKASPETRYEFLTKRLNVWGGAKSAWLPIEQWLSCDGVLDLDDLEAVPCYGGLDLASTADTASWCLVWRVGGRIKIRPRIYCPEDAIEDRTIRFSLPYELWRDEGFLVATPGNVIDYEVIEKDIRDDLERFNIAEIGYDTWNSYDLANRLTSDGAPMAQVIQGPKSFNEAMRQTEIAVLSGQIDHGGHPVLNWQASNLVARKDANDNMAPDKKRSKEKIDGMVAYLNALGRLLVCDESGPVNPYDGDDAIELAVM